MMMKNLFFNGFFVLIASISSAGAFFSFHVLQKLLMPNGYLC